MNTKQTQPEYVNPQDDESIDFKRYISLFISNWYWFAIALFISLSIAYGINRWSEKVYTVSSTLLIKDDKFSGSNAELANIFPGTNAFKSQQNLKNEIGILKSFNINYRVMRELPDFHVEYIAVGKRRIVESRMYNRCPFIVVYDSIEKQRIGQKVEIEFISENRFHFKMNGDKANLKEYGFGDRINERGFDIRIEKRKSGGFVFDPDASNKYYFYFISPTTQANSYRSKLSVSPIEEEASLVTLTISGLVPQQEADYLNKLMAVYLDYGLEVKNQTAGQTIEFINKQLSQISDSLGRAERILEDFRLANKLIDISSEGDIIQRKLEVIESERTSLYLQETYYNYLKNYIESKSESKDIVAPSVMGVTDELLLKLVDELAKFQKDKKLLAMNLNDSAKPLEILEANINSTRAALTENIGNGLKNIRQSKSDIDLKLSKVEGEILKLPSTERKMISIQRKFDINNTVYTYLLEKKAEVGIAKAANVPDNRIIDYAGAYNSSRIKPKERKNLMLALIIGLLFPSIAILLIDYMNNKIIDKKDIEKGTSAPVLGYISHNSLKSEMPVVKNPGSTLTESFRSVRTNLRFFLKDSQCPVISVTSTITGEGKTFVSANLAAILAMSGKKVLLIGLDLRKPRIHKIFGINNESGLSNYLIGEKAFGDVVLKTEIDNLWYATAGPVPPNPAELIESDSMKEFIEKAKNEFDYIVIDTPPVAIVTDALLVSSFTDFYLFVVRQRYSSKNTLELIDEFHKNDRIKSIGIVINDISLSGYYGYGLRYGYALGYGYNYGYNYYSHYGKYGYKESSRGYYKED